MDDNADLSLSERVWKRVLANDYEDKTPKKSAKTPAERLLESIQREYGDGRFYSRLACKTSNRRNACLFRKIAQDEKRHLKKLSAAYFLMTGDSPRLEAPAEAGNPSFLEALRKAYEDENAAAARYLAAAADTDDPKLSAVFRELANDERAHAETISGITECIMT